MIIKLKENNLYETDTTSGVQTDLIKFIVFSCDSLPSVVKPFSGFNSEVELAKLDKNTAIIYGLSTVSYPVMHAGLFKTLFDNYAIPETAIKNTVSGSVSVNTNNGSLNLDVYDLKNVAKNYSSELATKLHDAAAEHFLPSFESQHNLLKSIMQTIKSAGLKFSFDTSITPLSVDSLGYMSKLSIVDITGSYNTSDKALATINNCLSKCKGLLKDTTINSYINSKNQEVFTLTVGSHGHIVLVYLAYNAKSNIVTGYIDISAILDNIA